MSVGSWNPDNDSDTSNNDTSKSIDTEFLQRCLSYATNDSCGTNDGVIQLNELVSVEDQQNHGVLHNDQALWNNALTAFSPEQHIQLIRFFTLAEMQLPGWQAGEKSPVIAITQHLKQCGGKLEKSDLMWIRKHSTNRFIPNGAISL